MSETPEVSVEAPRKKKRGKKIALILLAILLVCGIGVGAYVYSIGADFDQNTKKFAEAFPDSSGNVSQSEIQDFIKNYEAANPKTTKSEGQNSNAHQATAVANEDQTKLEKNKSAIDSNGNGIPDSVEGGKVTSRPVAQGGTNILLLGSDSRAGTDAAQFITGQRADTIMVVHIPSDGSEVSVVSVMRDTWVNIPGYGSAKINAGLNYGGISLQVATIEQVLNIHIDHVAEVDFTAFKGVVDTLGGVTVNVPITFSGDGFNFVAGPQHMDGATALAFVRQRYQFVDGDYQRVRNQRALIRGVLSALKSQGALASIPKFKSVLDALTPYLTLDNGFKASDILSVAQPVLTNGNTKFHMLTLPNAGTGWSADGQSIVVLDASATAALSNALNTNTMDSYVATYGEDASSF